MYVTLVLPPALVMLARIIIRPIVGEIELRTMTLTEFWRQRSGVAKPRRYKRRREANTRRHFAQAGARP